MSTPLVDHKNERKCKSNEVLKTLAMAQKTSCLSKGYQHYWKKRNPTKKKKKHKHIGIIENKKEKIGEEKWQGACWRNRWNDEQN
jgi:hypothetical protein